MALPRSILARQGVARLIQGPRYRCWLSSSLAWSNNSFITAQELDSFLQPSRSLLLISSSSSPGSSSATFSTKATAATTSSSFSTDTPAHNDTTLKDPLASDEFASMISNYIRQGQVAKACAHVQELQTLFRSKLNPSYCPSIHGVNLLLTGMLQEGQALQQEEQEMYHSFSPQGPPPVRETTDPSSPPQLALQLLEQMKSLSRHYGMDVARPNHETYELVLEIWRTYHPKHPQQLQDLLHSFERDHELLSSSSPDQQLPEFPSLAMYQTVMNCWALSDHPKSASAKGAMAFLEHMHKYSQNDPPVVKEKAKSATPLPPQPPRHPRLWMKPNESIYTTVMQAWSRSFDWDGPRYAQRLLETMDLQYQIMAPSMETYRWALLTCSRSLRKYAPMEAQSIFDRAWRRYLNSQDPALRPTVIMCNILLHVWAKQGHAIQCENIFQQYYHPTLAPPNVVTYTTLLQAWSKSKQLQEAPARAMEILHIMLQEYRNGNEALLPTAQTYSALLNTWGRSEQPDAADQALAIFEGLWLGQYPIQSAAAFQHQEDLEKDNANFQSMTSSSSSSSKSLQEDSRDETRRLRRLLQRQDNRIPNLFHANAVLNAFAKHGDGPRAEDFLRRRMPELELTPCVISYNTVLNAWNKTKNNHDAIDRALALFEEMKDKGVSPDAKTYGSLITTWSKSDLPHAAERAQELFHKLQEEHAKNKANPDLRAGVAECNALLDAWARHRGGGGPQRAEEELRRMLQPFLPPSISNVSTLVSVNTPSALERTKNTAPYVTAKPNSLCFNTVMAGYARQSKTDNHAPERAEAVLTFMNDIFTHAEADIPCSPSEWAYTCVIQAWSECASRRRDALSRAFRLHQEMVQKYESGHGACRPRGYIYAALLRTILKSDHLTTEEKTDEARYVLRDMEKHGFVPDHRINRYVQLCEGRHDEVYDDDLFP